MLTFDLIRRANLKRLPLFKNRHGELVHTSIDGSDWSPERWLQALVGEVGEYANLRKKFDRGDIDEETFKQEAAKELADVFTYLDLLANRLDVDLGDAVMQKWNEVSQRVGVDLFIASNGFEEEIVNSQGNPQ